MLEKLYEDKIRKVIEEHKKEYEKEGKIKIKPNLDLYTCVQISDRNFFEVTSEETSTIINVQDDTKDNILVKDIEKFLDSFDISFDRYDKKGNLVKFRHNYR
jgi:hypothetical protein